MSSSETVPAPWVIGAAWKRVADDVWTMGMTNPYIASWPGNKRSTSSEPAYLMLCSGVWKIFRKVQSCSAGEYYTVATSASATAPCPTQAIGWTFKNSAGAYVAASVSTACGGCCDHFTIAGAEEHNPMSMTLYSKQAGVMHNGRPTWASANSKVLFYDGTRWRVAGGSFPTTGGDLQSAEATTHCPSEAWGWESYFSRGSDGWWTADAPVTVSCDCPCSQLTLDATKYHKLGLSQGSASHELAGIGDGGRPVYKDYVGQSLMWSEASYSWYTSSKANSAGEPSWSYGLSTTTAASTAFCPVDIPSSEWLPASVDFSASCACKCTQVEFEITLPEAAGSAGIFTMDANIKASGRPVFATPQGLYLYYYGAELRWMVGASYTSDAGVLVRSSLTSGYCPLTTTTSWWAKQTDGTWRDDSVEATCVPYSFKPPAPPPPLPPFDELCACPIYKVTSSYTGHWASALLSDYSFRVDEVASGKPHNGGRPVLTTVQKMWSRDYYLYYFQTDGRWHIAHHNNPEGFYTTYRSAKTSAFCADGATGWEVRTGRDWSPIGVDVSFECVQHSPPAPPPTLVTSSMITCLPQMTQDACSYFATQKGRTFSKDLKVCFGQKDGGYDACSKDEGAPLVVHGANGKMVQVGIASKTGCGAANTPTEYTKVSKYLSWITAQVDDPKAKCMQTCPVDGCTNVGSPGGRSCRGHCQVCNSFGWG